MWGLLAWPVLLVWREDMRVGGGNGAVCVICIPKMLVPVSIVLVRFHHYLMQ